MGELDDRVEKLEHRMDSADVDIKLALIKIEEETKRSIGAGNLHIDDIMQLRARVTRLEARLKASGIKLDTDPGDE